MAFFTLFRAFVLRRLRLRPLRQALVAVAIALGVAVFLAVRILESSALRSAREAFESVLGPDRVVVSAGDAGFDENAITLLSRIPGVREVSGYLQAPVTLRAGGRSAGALLVGLPAGAKPGAIRPGTSLARRLSLAEGTVAELIGISGAREASVGPAIADPRLAAAQGGDVVVAELEWARGLLGKAYKFDRADLVLDEGADPSAVAEAVRATFGGALDARHPERVAESFGHALGTYRGVLAIYAWLALLVGALAAASAMSVSISERSESLGLARAIGAGRRTVVALCIAEGALLGAIGAAAGVPIAFALAALVKSSASGAMSMLAGTELEIRWLHADAGTLLLAAAAGVAAALLGSLVPAVRAGRMAPLDALRPWGLDREPARPRRASGSFVGGLAVRLAWLNLRRRPGRAFHTVAALGLGFGLFALLATATASIKATIGARYEKLYRPDLVVRARVGALDEALGKELASIKGVAQAIGIREQMVRYGGEPVLLRAYDQPQSIIDFRIVDVNDAQVSKAAAAFFGSWDVTIFVSTSFASRFGVKTGQRIRLDTPTGAENARIVAAAIDLGGPAGTIGMDRWWYSHLWADRTVSYYMVQLDPDADTDALAAEIERRLGPGRDLSIETAGVFRESILSAVDRVFAHLALLEWVALVLGALGLVNTLLAEVVARRREQGLLRAIGMSARQLERMIMVEGLLQGVAAGCAGTLAGTAAGAALVRYGIGPAFGWTPALVVPAWLLAAMLAGAAALALASAFLPARRAARMEIRAALERA